MISKECFINTIMRLEDLDNKMDKVDAALKELTPNFGGFYIPEILDIVVDLLKNALGCTENDNMLEFLVYELDFLRKYKQGMLKDGNLEEVDLSTWSKVYDFLVDWRR